jgi:hypothetical protein
LSQKLPTLFANIISFIKTYKPTQEKFDIMLKQVQQAQGNSQLSSSSAARHARAKALFLQAFLPADILFGLAGATFEVGSSSSWYRASITSPGA